MEARPGAEELDTLQKLWEEARRWGLSAEDLPPPDLLYRRWLAGTPLWGEWLPDGATRPRLVSAAEAAELSDCELAQLISTIESAAAGFADLSLPAGDWQHLAENICGLEVGAARRSASPEYHLFLGAPGSGKSALIGRARPSICQLDPDRLRATHPWWCGGLGTKRVLLFTNVLRDLIFAQALQTRVSLVEEAVGANVDKLVARVGSAQDAGYTVAITLVEAAPRVQSRRRLERTAVTGRILHPVSLSADPRRAFAALHNVYPEISCHATPVRDMAS